MRAKCLCGLLQASGLSSSSSILRNKTKVTKFVPEQVQELGTLITEANCILVTNLKIVTKRTKSLLFGTFFAHNKEDIDR